MPAVSADELSEEKGSVMIIEQDRCDFCDSKERVAVSPSWPGEPARICLDCAKEVLETLNVEERHGHDR
jgi:hypothetical protein